MCRYQLFRCPDATQRRLEDFDKACGVAGSRQLPRTVQPGGMSAITRGLRTVYRSTVIELASKKLYSWIFGLAGHAAWCCCCSGQPEACRDDSFRATFLPETYDIHAGPTASVNRLNCQR